MSHAWLIVLALAATSSPVFAQTPPPARGPQPPRPPMFEIAGLGSIVGPVSFGTTSETLIRPNGSDYTMFRVSSRLAAGFGAEAQVGIQMTPTVVAEVGGTWAVADLESRVSADTEGAEDATIAEPLHRFSVEGSLRWTAYTRGLLSVFVGGGAGWMREVVDGGTLVEDGVIVNAGGGMKYLWLDAPRGTLRRIGMRVEGRLSVRSTGITLAETGARVAPVLSVGIFVGF